MADTTLLTTAEVADRLNLDPKTVRRMVAAGKLPAVRLPGGGHMRYRWVDVEQALDPEGRTE